MAETIETVTIERETMTVSLLVWRRFKKTMPGLVERIYATNPGLAKLGAHLPLGTIVKIPVPDQVTAQDITPVRLWVQG